MSDAQTAPADDDEDDFGSKRQFCAPGATNNVGNQEELWPMGVLKFIYAMKYNASGNDARALVGEENGPSGEIPVDSSKSLPPGDDSEVSRSGN